MISCENDCHSKIGSKNVKVNTIKSMLLIVLIVLVIFSSVFFRRKNRRKTNVLQHNRTHIHLHLLAFQTYSYNIKFTHNLYFISHL